MLAALLIAQLNDLFATQDARTQANPRIEVGRQPEESIINESVTSRNTRSRIDIEAQKIPEMDITETTGMGDEITPVRHTIHGQSSLIVVHGQEDSGDQSALFRSRVIPDNGGSRLSRIFDRVEDKIETALSLPLGQEAEINPSQNAEMSKEEAQGFQSKSHLQNKNNTDTTPITVPVFLAHAPIFPLFSLYFLFCVLSIELTIRYNQISGVNELPSASQLIPFIIGLASICQNGFTLMLNVAGILDVWRQTRRGFACD
jgi:hypothetical protein